MQLKAPDGSVMISGTLGNDAEYKKVGETMIDLTTFSVAVGKRDNGSGQKQTIWVSVNCWREMALRADGLKKGDIVLVIGQPGQREYTGRDGTPKVQKFVNAEFVIPAPNAVYHSAPADDPATANAPSPSPAYDPTIEESGDLPF